jgi:16S rRNA (cytosine1402-N4)-methyltransferase
VNGDAGHLSVLLTEAIEALAVRPDRTYVDCTFGRGGHSRAILARLCPTGRLIALDRDAQAIAAGREIVDMRLTLIQSPFSRLGEVLRSLSVRSVAGVLLDLGVSTPQLDEGQRGFSFRTDAPLDMRMDPSQGEPLADWLARASEKEIARVVRDYGEERFAHAVAKAIVAARDRGAVATTRQLAAIVEKAVRTREPGQHPATRTFQALRIHTNRELEELSLVLPQALEALEAGGRLVAISFHSLEDRIVKRFMREASQPAGVPAKLPLRASEMPQPRARLVCRAMKPSAREMVRNPRARSAVMRVIEKIR